MKDNPHMYRYLIKEFYDAYRILEEDSPMMHNLFFVKAFLLGRVIELIFKIQLIQKGFSSDQLKKRDLGHNLINLLQLLGFPDRYGINTTTFDAINHLNLYYSDKKYEYPTAQDVEVKNVKFLENFINLSLRKIDFHLNSDSKWVKSEV